MDPLTLASLVVAFLTRAAGSAGSEVGKVLGQRAAQAIAPAMTAPAQKQALTAVRAGTASPAVTIALERQVALHAQTNPTYARQLEEIVVRLSAELTEAQRQLDGKQQLEDMRERFSRRNQEQRDRKLAEARAARDHELTLLRMKQQPPG